MHLQEEQCYTLRQKPRKQVRWDTTRFCLCCRGEVPAFSVTSDRAGAPVAGVTNQYQSRPKKDSLSSRQSPLLTKSKQDIVRLSDDEFDVLCKELRQLRCYCGKVCAPRKSDTPHGSHDFGCKVVYACSHHYEDMRLQHKRQLDGSARKQQHPQGKRIGSLHFQEREQADNATAAFHADVQRLRQTKCRCRQQCDGAWSDSAHGSHGMMCKVPYQRFLTLRERFLTQGHSDRPNAKSQYKYGVFEFFAGALTMCWAWFLLCVPSMGICESYEPSLLAAAELFPEAALFADANSGSWQHAQDSHVPIEVLSGGFPCTPYSTAGPQHGRKHKDAGLLGAMIKAAIQVDARWILFENVLSLLENFLAFFNQSIAEADPDKLFCTISTETMRHNHLGGRSQRHRVWPLLERFSVTCLLPPWPIHKQHQTPGRILDALKQPLPSFDLPGTFSALTEPIINSNGLIRVGSFSYGLSGNSVAVGSLVRFSGSSTPYEVVTLDADTLSVKQVGSDCAQQWQRSASQVSRVMPPLIHGVTVYFRGNNRPFVLIRVEGCFVHVLHDSRSRPRWYWVNAR